MSLLVLAHISRSTLTSSPVRGSKPALTGRIHFWKRLPLIAFNLTILTALTVVGLAMGYTAFDFGWQGGALVVGQFLFLVFLDDAYFYFFHRLLHVNPYLYKKVHKVHHRAFAPFPLEYIYVHPLEWMFGALAIPVGLGCIFSRQWFNLRSRILGLRILAEFPRNRYSLGASFVSRNVDSIYGTTEHHDRHHMKKTQGNYASTFTIWDRALKTYIPPTS